MHALASYLGFAIPVLVFILWREASRLAGPCAGGCRRRAWWRVILVVRPAKGARPDPLARLPMPVRLCGRCFRDLKKGDPRPLREDRKTIGAKLARIHGEKPDWNRTQNDREHVVAAHLRGLK